MLDVLDIVSAVLGILGVSFSIPAIALWEKVIKPGHYRRKYRKIRVDNAYILIVGRKKDIDDAKGKIRRQQETSLAGLKGLPQMIIKLPDNCTAATPADLVKKLEAMRATMAKADKLDVHLFYTGPVVLTAFLGGFFYNKNSVYMYHHDFKSKTYECWGPLALSTTGKQ